MTYFRQQSINNVTLGFILFSTNIIIISGDQILQR